MTNEAISPLIPDLWEGARLQLPAWPSPPRRLLTATLQVPPTACAGLGEKCEKIFLPQICFQDSAASRWHLRTDIFSGAFLILSGTFGSRFLGNLVACSSVAWYLISPYPRAVGRGTRFAGKVIVKLNIKLSKNWLPRQLWFRLPKMLCTVNHASFWKWQNFLIMVF